jgi:hypothetical protein
MRSLQRQAYLWPRSWGADEEVDYKRAGAAEFGAAVELLASQPKAMKFRLMPAVRLLRFFFCYCPSSSKPGTSLKRATSPTRCNKWNFPATLQSESIQ